MSQPVRCISTVREPAHDGAQPADWRYECKRPRCESVGRSVRLSDSAGVFEQLFEDEVQLCIWNRDPDEILGSHLERSIRSGGWARRMAVPVMERGMRAAVQEFLAGSEGGLGRIRLATELLGLIDLFAMLSDARRIDVRIVATRRRICPRFHTDALRLRLLCTWVGEGTEWVAQEDVVAGTARSGSGGSSMARLVRADATVHRMDTFAVGVLKGAAWPHNRGRGAVHRSPRANDWRVWVSLASL